MCAVRAMLVCCLCVFRVLLYWAGWRSTAGASCMYSVYCVCTASLPGDGATCAVGVHLRMGVVLGMQELLHMHARPASHDVAWQRKLMHKLPLPVLHMLRCCTHCESQRTLVSHIEHMYSLASPEAHQFWWHRCAMPVVCRM
jgi:hypothetical protein